MSLASPLMKYNLGNKFGQQIKTSAIFETNQDFCQTVSKSWLTLLHCNKYSVKSLPQRKLGSNYFCLQCTFCGCVFYFQQTLTFVLQMLYQIQKLNVHHTWCTFKIKNQTAQFYLILRNSVSSVVCGMCTAITLVYAMHHQRQSISCLPVLILIIKPFGVFVQGVLVFR